MIEILPLPLKAGDFIFLIG